MNQRWLNCKESYDSRMKKMLLFVDPNKKVLDLGSGQCKLEKYLPDNFDYFPCDLVKRDERTIVCDFNNSELPEFKYYDCVIGSGILEYILNLPLFLRNISEYSNHFIFSYAYKQTGKKERCKQGWVNHYTKTDIYRLFKIYFNLLDVTVWENQLIFKLERKQNG